MNKLLTLLLVITMTSCSQAVTAVQAEESKPKPKAMPVEKEQSTPPTPDPVAMVTLMSAMCIYEGELNFDCLDLISKKFTEGKDMGQLIDEVKAWRETVK